MRHLAVCLAVLAVAGSVQASVFSVGHAGYIARDGKIWFRNILEDSDLLWNQHRSHFECREPGFYFISFHGLSRRGSPVTLGLNKNYREVLAAYGDGGGYNTASNSGVFYLNRGDTVSLHVLEGRVHESSIPSRNYITLSGFKIADRSFSPPRRPSAGRPVSTNSRPLFGSGATAAAGRPKVQVSQGGGGKDGPTVAATPDRGGEDGFVPLDGSSEQGGPN